MNAHQNAEVQTIIHTEVSYHISWLRMSYQNPPRCRFPLSISSSFIARALALLLILLIRFDRLEECIEDVPLLPQCGTLRYLDALVNLLALSNMLDRPAILEVPPPLLEEKTKLYLSSPPPY